MIHDRVAADSIVNRLANNSRRIDLGSVDMRGERKCREFTPCDSQALPITAAKLHRSCFLVCKSALVFHSSGEA